MTKEEILVQSGLNWNVREIGLKTDDDFGLVVPKTKSIWREQNGHDDIYLGVHKEGYELFQNEELVEILMRATEIIGGDIELKKGGMFNNGQKVFVQLKTDNHRMPNGDNIEGYITGINSFDGGTSLGFGNSTVTISCGNSFWYSYHELDTKIRHTSKLRERVEEVVQKFSILMEQEKEHFKTIDKLNDVYLTPEIQDLVQKKMFNISREDRWDKAYSEMSTRKRNQVDNFLTDLNLEKMDKGENLWGLFSGITRFTTHSMKKTGDNTKSKMIGVAGRKERQIWSNLEELTV